MSSSSEAGTNIAAPRDAGRLARGAREVLVPVAAVALLVLAWEVSVHAFDIPVYLLPAPSVIWRDCVAVAGNIALHTYATMITIMLGFLASIVVSLPLAVLLTSSATVANAVYPILVFTQSIPKVALAPILVVMLGANELPRVVITFLVAFFPLVISIATGFLSVPPELIELGKSYRASRLRELYRIRLPYAVPFIFSGLKVAITLAVVGAIVAEFVNADRGLGYLIITSTAFFKVPVAFGAVILLSLIGILLFQAVVVIERVFFPWSSSVDALAA